jgi:hypothetical protein
MSWAIIWEDVLQFWLLSGVCFYLFCSGDSLPSSNVYVTFILYMFLAIIDTWLWSHVTQRQFVRNLEPGAEMDFDIETEVHNIRKL